MIKYSLFLSVICINLLYGQVNGLLKVLGTGSQEAKGFIKNASLTVEPHGAYALQTIEVEYTDNNLLPGYDDLEIKHGFSLPPGALVNDLRVWVGDSLLKAVVVDLYTGWRLYYNYKTTNKAYRPAILRYGYNGENDYELKVFPLKSGNYKKVQLSFIVPLKWEDNIASIELPLGFLHCNNESIKPLKIVFKNNIGAKNLLKILEKPELNFNHLKDSLNYSYYSTILEDISDLESITLNTDLYTNNGAFYESGLDTENVNNFQISINHLDLLDFKEKPQSLKTMIGIDLSGYSYKDLDSLKNNIKNLLASKLIEDDFFKLIITGAGENRVFTNEWVKYSMHSIDSVYNKFMQSELANAISQVKKKNVYCVSGNSNYYGFKKYSPYVNLIYSDDINKIKPQLNDVVVNNTYMDEASTKSFNDSNFIKNGGRYISFGRNNYMENLRFYVNSNGFNQFYYTKDGNLGSYLPDKIMFELANKYIGNHNYSLTKEELVGYISTSNDLYPVIVSQKYGEGLVISTTVWPFSDHSSIENVNNTGLPLLGVTGIRPLTQLTQLLDKIKEEYLVDNFDEVIIISNSDSLTNSHRTSNWVTSYLLNFINKKPRFFTINLVKNLEDDLWTYDPMTKNYYARSGYLLNELAIKTNGKHYECSKYKWPEIYKMIKIVDYPAIKEYTVEKYADGIKDNFLEFKEVMLEPQFSTNPLFFIGSTTAKNNIAIKINAKITQLDTIISKAFSFQTINKEETIIPALLAYKIISDTLKSNPYYYDREFVKKMSIKYNIMSEDRSMVVLFPGETQNFLYNYLYDVEEKNALKDYDLISAYPNPFNAETQILVKLKEPGKVNISIYNILGQLVTRIAENEEVIGSKTYTWNGKEDYNITASSGIYFTKVEIENSRTKEKKIKTIKLMMLK